MVGLLAGGGYAQQVATNPRLTWPVPDAVTDEQALAVVLQGTTAWHLLRTSAHLAEGESVVVIAGAGGVGSLAVQLAKRWGAGRVIATASSPDKRELAESLGADATVDPALADDDPKSFTAALREANGGKRVDVVLEMTGGHVLDGSLSALAPFGRLVAYGMAGREAPKPVNVPSLMGTSRAVIGFWLAHCFGRPEMLDQAMGELLAAGRRRRAEAGVRRPLPADRRPRGPPGPPRPPDQRQAHPRPHPLRTVPSPEGAPSATGTAGVSGRPAPAPCRGRSGSCRRRPGRPARPAGPPSGRRTAGGSARPSPARPPPPR